MPPQTKQVVLLTCKTIEDARSDILCLMNAMNQMAVAHGLDIPRICLVSSRWLCIEKQVTVPISEVRGILGGPSTGGGRGGTTVGRLLAPASRASFVARRGVTRTPQRGRGAG